MQSTRAGRNSAPTIWHCGVVNWNCTRKIPKQIARHTGTRPRVFFCLPHRKCLETNKYQKRWMNACPHPHFRHPNDFVHDVQCAQLDTQCESHINLLVFSFDSSVNDFHWHSHYYWLFNVHTVHFISFRSFSRIVLAHISALPLRVHVRRESRFTW